MFKHKTLFDVLVSEGVLSVDNISQLGRYVEKWSVSQYKSVVETNLLSESRLMDILAKSLNLTKKASLRGSTACFQCIGKFTQEVAKDRGFIVLAESTNVRRFVCADPFVVPDFLQECRNMDQGTKISSELALSTRSEIQRKIQASYGAYALANTIESEFDTSSSGSSK